MSNNNDNAAYYQVPTTVDEVREYVTNTASLDTGRSQYLVLLNVEHSNLKQTHISDLRLDIRTTIGELKNKLYLHTGTQPSSMRLFHNHRQLIEECKTLQAYGVLSGDTIFLMDDDPLSVSANGWLEDTSLVPKYKLTDEQYDKKENTYRKYKQKMRQNDPTWSMTGSLKKNKDNNINQIDVNIDEDLSKQFAVGSRCQVNPGGKRATVRLVDKQLEHLPHGWWIGVEYDEPVGKNDGSVRGVRYFTVPNKFGGFVRPSNVTVGDFPPLGIDDDDDDDDDEEL